MRRHERARFWLELAAGDLAKARRLAEPPAFPDGTCFFAQQAAEKAVKGYLCFVGVGAIPRIHDLLQLLSLLPEGAPAPFERGVLSTLSEYAVTPRYYKPAPTVEEADQAIRWAEEVVRQVAALVREARGEDG